MEKNARIHTGNLNDNQANPSFGSFSVMIEDGIVDKTAIRHIRSHGRHDDSVADGDIRDRS